MAARDALKSYYARLAKKQARANGPRRRNKHPELEVQREVLAWLVANGFSCQRIESKACYSAKAQRYTRGQAMAGTADIIGCGPNGEAVFIEMKAPGRRSALKHHQYEFLRERIMMFGFAVVADGSAFLENAWQTFISKRQVEPALARDYLLKLLPQPPTRAKEFDLFPTKEEK